MVLVFYMRIGEAGRARPVNEINVEVLKGICAFSASWRRRVVVVARNRMKYLVVSSPHEIGIMANSKINWC